MHPVDISRNTPRNDNEESGRGGWLAAIALIAIVALVVVALVALSGGETEQPPAEDQPIETPIDPGY